jgi:hypothetical protein
MENSSASRGWRTNTELFKLKDSSRKIYLSLAGRSLIACIHVISRTCRLYLRHGWSLLGRRESTHRERDCKAVYIAHQNQDLRSSGRPACVPYYLIPKACKNIYQTFCLEAAAMGTYMKPCRHLVSTVLLPKKG